MEGYTDLGRDSEITFFEVNKFSILVQFKDRGSYVYNYSVTGEIHVEEMKKLARIGEGLNEYINKNVRRKYAAKL